MNSFSITTFLASKKISSEPVFSMCKQLLEKTGYEIVFEFDFDETALSYLYLGEYYPYDNYAKIVVCLDLIPWREENKNTNIRKAVLEKSISDNYRTSWAISTVLFFLNENLENSNKNCIPFHNEIDHLYPAMDTIVSFNFLKTKIARFDSFIAKLDNAVKVFSFPFEVIEVKTDYGCNNKIAIVENENRKYICKVFKPNKLKYLRNEVSIYEYFTANDFIPEIIDHRENWILIEYFDDIQIIPQKLNRLGVLPISISKKIFFNLKKLWNAGFVHMDFHPGNILFYRNRVFFIDFEYSYAMDTKSDSFLNSPGLVLSDRLKYDAPLHHINYSNFWRKWVGFELSEIVNSPKLLLIIRRLPQYIRYWVHRIKERD